MNKEKYADPTAEAAIANVMREEKRKRIDVSAFEIQGAGKLVRRMTEEVKKKNGDTI